MFQQVTCEGNFGQAQKEANCLKHCWGQMHLAEGEDQLLGCSSFHGELLYYHADCQSQPCDLLPVPHSKIYIVMHLAHSHPFGGHLGAANIFAQLSDPSAGWAWELRSITSASSALNASTPPQPNPLLHHSFLFPSSNCLERE